ncbi:MAG: hypothetical protein ACI31A_08120 [Candidatus Limisoma sp.]
MAQEIKVIRIFRINNLNLDDCHNLQMYKLNKTKPNKLQNKSKKRYGMPPDAGRMAKILHCFCCFVGNALYLCD